MNKRGGLAKGTQTYQRNRKLSATVNLTQEQVAEIPVIMAPPERNKLSNAINLALQESERELLGSDYVEIVNRLQTTAISALEIISTHQRMEVDTIINQLILNYLDQYRGRI